MCFWFFSRFFLGERVRENRYKDHEIIMAGMPEPIFEVGSGSCKLIMKLCYIFLQKKVEGTSIFDFLHFSISFTQIQQEKVIPIYYYYYLFLTF